MVKVSIIIPVYDASDFLVRCLESLMAQTVSSLEIICVDDGSLDNSLQILHHYEQLDSRVKVVSQANSGPATARNVGLSLAGGEYIMFCDSDDWYDSTMCEEMLHVLESEKVDCVMCGIQIEDESSSSSCNRGTEDISYYQVPCEGRFDLDDTLRMQVNVFSMNKILKKSLINQYHIAFPEGLYNHEDDAFIFQYLGVANNIYFLNKNLYHYFRREGSLHGQEMTGRNQGKTVRIDIVRFCYAWLIENRLRARLEGYFLEMYCLEFSSCYKNLYDEQLDGFIQKESLFLSSLGVNGKEFRKKGMRQLVFAILKTQRLPLECIIYGVRVCKIRKYKFLSVITFGAMGRKYYEKCVLEEGKRRRCMPMPRS